MKKSLKNQKIYQRKRRDIYPEAQAWSQILIRVPIPVIAALQSLAVEDSRTVPQMAKILLEESLKAKGLI